jgi:lipopolysaccharide/colanic/teichoic acid biosynthesis glycosyltransferase
MSATLIDVRTTTLEPPVAERSTKQNDGVRHSLQSTIYPPSDWSRSRTKRCFDVLAVLLSLPLALPILGVIGICVYLGSRGSTLFVQVRIGKGGQSFKIYKFRTMLNNSGSPRPSVTTLLNQEFTSIGPFLRKWKLDELPQLLNVLRGDMSLVGPRPKMPEHQSGPLFCRPGVTGAATLAFGREELLLAGIPKNELDDFVRNVLTPLKSRMDGEYMASASFLSDLKLIIRSVFRKWPDKCLELGAMGSKLGPAPYVITAGRAARSNSPHQGIENLLEGAHECD